MRAFSEIRLSWALLAVLAVADVLGLHATGLSLRLAPCLFVGGACLFLFLIERVYAKIRRDPRLAGLALTGLQLLLYTALAGILSYLLTAAGRPLVDDALVAFDRALGFDWEMLPIWGKDHVFAHLALILAYYSLIPQLILVQIVLYTTRRFERGREVFWLFTLTSLFCVLIAGVFPAAGAFVVYGQDLSIPYVRDFLALRDGSLKTIDLVTMQGVVQFPSFHLAMALILAYGARGVRILFPLLLIVNTAVVVATPLVGGHHLADLVGGLVVTLAAVGITYCRRGFRRPQASSRS